MIRRIMLLLSAVLTAVGSLAADVKIDISANRSSMYLGESVILTVKISGTDAPPQPDLSAITNASVRFLGSHSDNHYSIMIVNGKVTKDSFSGRIFTYEARPSNPGRFVAGPVKLNIDGQTISQAGPVIEVAGVEKQEWAIVTISASRDTVLVDEPFAITLSLALKRLPAPYADYDPLDANDPPALAVSFLNLTPIDGLRTPDVQAVLQSRLVSGRNAAGFTLNDYTLPRNIFDFDFDSFMTEKKAKFLFEKRPTERNGTQYFDYTIKLTYVPMQEGSYIFGPAEFKGKIITGTDAGGRGLGKTIFAVGPACTVRVVPPPEEGRPSSYVGALGTNLQVEASLDTQTCNVGDPLKLTLSLSGNVRMENIFQPQLSLQPELSEKFRINEDTVEAIAKDNRKEYVYMVRPTQAGTYELPPIEVSYYDTKERRYKRVKTQPIPIRANEILSVQGSNIIFTATNRNGHGEQRRENESLVIGPLNADPTGATPCPLGPRPWHVVLIVLGPVLYGIVRITRHIRKNFPDIARKEKRRHAARRALSLLQQANQQVPVNAHNAHRLICDALRGYLGDRFNVVGAGLTPADARQLLIEKIGDSTLADTFGNILERSFNAGFSQAAVSDDTAVHDSQEAVRVIQRIEQAYRSTNKESRP